VEYLQTKLAFVDFFCSMNSKNICNLIYKNIFFSFSDSFTVYKIEIRIRISLHKPCELWQLLSSLLEHCRYQLSKTPLNLTAEILSRSILKGSLHKHNTNQTLKCIRNTNHQLIENLLGTQFLKTSKQRQCAVLIPTRLFVHLLPPFFTQTHLGLSVCPSYY